MSINCTTDPAGVISRNWVSGVFWNDYDDELDVWPGREVNERARYAGDEDLRSFMPDHEPGEADDD